MDDPAVDAPRARSSSKCLSASITGTQLLARALERMGQSPRGVLAELDLLKLQALLAQLAHGSW